MKVRPVRFQKADRSFYFISIYLLSKKLIPLKNKITYFLCISYFIFHISHFISSAQDIHFSQYNSSPANLNPALTGMFDGDYRFVGNHRAQWRSVTVPFNSSGGSFDMKNIFGLKNSGTGFSVYKDKAGDSQFSTLQINLASAYHIPLTSEQNQYLSLGFQGGYNQKNINYNSLSFNEQYQGSYNPNATNGESFPNNSLSYLNLNSGIYWNYYPKNRVNISSGIALNNINKPKQSLFNNDEINLDRRLSFFGSGQFLLNEKMDVLPSFLIMGQGEFREIVVGASLKRYLNPVNGRATAIYLGGWVRTRDAGFVSVGMDYNNVNIGLSYDINYSTLNTASNYRGAFEVSVIYIFKKFVPINTKYKACPSFI